MAEIYWKMLRLSAAIRAGAAPIRPGDRALLDARRRLWRGQANDAYWHGVFGGCYLPHLRRAVKTALLEAEFGSLSGGAPLEIAAADVNGDGRDEILVRTPDLSITLNHVAGGTLTEISCALGPTTTVARRVSAGGRDHHARLAGGAEAQGATALDRRHDAGEGAGPAPAPGLRPVPARFAAGRALPPPVATSTRWSRGPRVG